ncbi:MAG TPA: MMPL family transporter, partial [Gaiellaceae bacterium]|nr:MMPL family transporter [Gaiellaceae bacterium]
MIGWLVALIGLSVISQSVGSAYKDSFSLNGTQSFDALNLLKKVAPKAAGDREQIVVAVTQGKVTDPAVRSQVEAMLTKVAALGDVASVSSPYGPAGAAQISSSGQIAFANVTLTKQAPKITVSEAKQFVDTAKSGAKDGVQVELEGQVAKAANGTSVSTTGLGALAALVILFLVFGSLLAATLPLITAGIALGSSTAIISLLSHLLTTASFSSELSLLIGLGVGV